MAQRRKGVKANDIRVEVEVEVKLKIKSDSAVEPLSH